ncbi:hypothetical protein TWF481_008862 [Arthrobotrys musiformis]|uniref:Uncharacterized protein n=1 Tax=Arthrobotrys musiformis TaxID=47236 RepID=A0AAV9WAE1_9PEZI
MSSFRNFAFPKKKMDADASKSPHLRPFLLQIPREEAMSIVNSSRPPKRVTRESFTQMNVPARERPVGRRGTKNDLSNRPKTYIPFAPQPSDLEKLMIPEKVGARCRTCNSNIVLNKVLKDNGDVNVHDSHLGEIFNIPRGHDESGTPVTVQMVWSCRINRHVYPSASSNSNGTALAIPSAVADTEIVYPKRLTLAGAQRWVNEMQELMRSGDVGRAKECMTQIVLMNEGMKRESFSWLEKEKASRLSAHLTLPKKISDLQQGQEEQQDPEKSDGPEEPGEPSEGEKLLKEFFDEEGSAIFNMITGEGTDFEYSGLAIDSSSESNPSEMATNAIEEPTEQPSVVSKDEAATTAVTRSPDCSENLTPDDKPVKTDVSAPFPQATGERQDQSSVVSSEDTFISKRLSKRFSLTNILTGFKKVSPSIKRVEGKHDLSKYAEEQAAAAASTAALLPAHGETMSLHEMLQEPFHRIAEESLKDLSGGVGVGAPNPEMPEHCLANVSSSDIQSEPGNDSTQEIERGLTVVTITSEPAGKREEE